MQLTLQIMNRISREEETRLYEMSESQASLFEETVALLSSRFHQPVEACAKLVQGIACQLLLGQPPREDSPSILHRLRFEFRPLSSAQIRELPIAGCPDGIIESIVIQAKIDEATGTRTVLLEFDETQTEFFNEGIIAFQSRNDMSRDEAWRSMVHIVGKLSSGAQLKDDSDDFFRFAAGVFPPIVIDQLANLPDATEEDVRRWCFR